MTAICLHEVALDSPAAAEVLQARYDELSGVLDGFAPTGGAPVHSTEFVPPQGTFVVAVDDDGEPVGCAGVRGIADGTGELKRVYVLQRARGRGVATALLEHLEERAVELGYRELRLASHGHPGALALYESAGYQPIDDYSGSPFARYWFAKSLIAA